MAFSGDVPQKFDDYAITVYISISLLILVLHLSFDHFLCGTKGHEEMNWYHEH
jgi:hypothetical protein